MRSIALSAALKVLLLTFAPSAMAVTVDLSLGTGLALGTIGQQKSDGSFKIFQVGGAPIMATFNRDFSQKWSGAVGAQIMLDIINTQVIRNGFTGAVSYHLLGGARQVEYPGEQVHVKSTSAQNISVFSRAGVFNYAASDPSHPSDNLAGGVWEVAGGLEYRRDAGENDAFGLTLTTTLLTVPASVQRLKTSMTELQLFWRRLY